MNEWCIYIALYCVLLYTQNTLQSCGGVSPQPPPVCIIHFDDAMAATGRLTPVRSPLTSYRWREERVIEPIKWMWIIRRSWLTRASGGNLARTLGYIPTPYEYIPTLYKKCHGIFNDHRVSGPQFNVSSEGRCFLQYSVPVTIPGH